MTSRTPTDELYQQGVPFQPEKVVNGIRLNNAASPAIRDDVDWNQVIDSGEKKGYATASATAHYHYQKLSHLLLCDNIVLDARNVPEPLQQVARQLAQQSAKEIKAWSKYMKHIGGGGSLPEEQQEYYQLLFSQQDVLSVLIVIQTGNLCADTSYEEFYKSADPAFRKLASGFAEENTESYNSVRDNLRNIIQPMDVEDRLRLLQNVAQYVDLFQILYQKRGDDIFSPLGSNVPQAQQQAGKKIKQFYDEIGLTAGVF